MSFDLFAPQAPAASQQAQRAREELLREAEAHRALAELFPHLKLDALRAIQDLFPLNARAEQNTARSSNSVH
ncbi:MAG: hypothetical protein Q8R98_07965 [Rubrivivax sp.]|nr:hypothetical protein [Rubrivivax sp.]MDP3221708.1 hypothetical protein [Rubrivivax sp.]MDP3611772.1 hypothetical protein [Rubrivivax sp.]